MSEQQTTTQESTPKNNNMLRQLTIIRQKAKKCFSEPIFWVLCVVFLISLFITTTAKSIELKDFLQCPFFIAVIITVLSGGVICIWLYYFRKESLKKYDSKYEKIGSDLIFLFSWFFSVEGLLLVLVGATVAFIVVVINNFCNIGSEKLQLTAFTLNLALCTLIPTLISRMVAKSHLDEIIEKKLEKELNNFKTSLYGIRRDKGHSCRMSAELLYQNAEKGGNVRNAIWSIGWASEAITQYLLIKDDYINAKERVMECLENIYKSYEVINGKKNEIKHRDLVSVLTMYSLLNHFCWVEDMERSVREKQRKELLKEMNITSGRTEPEIETEIEEKIKKKVIPLTNIIQYFYDNREDKTKVSGYACRITGMNGRFNKKIESEANNIIRNLESGNEYIKTNKTMLIGRG